MLLLGWRRGPGDENRRLTAEPAAAGDGVLGPKDVPLGGGAWLSLEPADGMMGGAASAGEAVGYMT